MISNVLLLSMDSDIFQRILFDLTVTASPLDILERPSECFCMNTHNAMIIMTSFR
jgi:hypothetical protein